MCRKLVVCSWTISISPRRRFGLRQPNKVLQMSNYFSIGVDAAVTLNFHNCRDTLPRAMSSRLLNKMLFFRYGTQVRLIVKFSKIIEFFFQKVRIFFWRTVAQPGVSWRLQEEQYEWKKAKLFVRKMCIRNWNATFQDVVERVCSGLTNCLELSLDDKVVELPALEG